MSSTRKHQYSQHFLRSPSLVAELVGHSNLRKNDIVYDLGAGSGVISSVLARRVKQVVAVEVEDRAVASLRQNLHGVDNVTIITKDIMNLLPQEESYKIFANIPFSLSSPIVRRYTALQRAPKAMYIIAQKQFARKLVPGDDHFTSQLSAEIGPWYEARIRKPLRKTDFTPPPAVDTVLLELRRRETPLIDERDLPRYREFVELAFSRQKYFVSLDREAAGISAEKRPSQLTLEQWVRLWEIA